MNDLFAVLLGLVTGATMVVAVSCIWGVLLIPARIQDRLQAASPRLLTIALAAGLMLSVSGCAADFSLHLPPVFGSIALLGGGMFVGMLASALGEILEVTPVLMRRFRLGNVSAGMRFVIMLAKGLGALLACLAITS